MEYRVLSRVEINQLHEIDRTETIDRVYHVCDGKLCLKEEHWDVEDWSDEEKQRRIAGLQEGYDAGDTLFGAFDGATLVGLSVLDQSTSAQVAGRFNLAGLWVSQAYRGQGVGRHLVELVMNKARALGAKTLYVSATSTENTVRFYTSMGFRLADPIDRNLFQVEPDDIHMEMTL
jgi:ribosomal protein S18 acetylase RimI-like enzyme